MLYIENRKKNTYEWMRKEGLIISSNAFPHGLRYEITKISVRKCFCHIQGGNYYFKIAVRNEYIKIFEKVTS